MRLNEKLNQRSSSADRSKALGRQIKEQMLRELIDGGASPVDVLTALVMTMTGLAIGMAGGNRAKARDMLGGAIDLALDGMDEQMRRVERGGEIDALRAEMQKASATGTIDYDTFRAVADKFKRDKSIPD